jgi:hypothetical protein
LKPSAVFAAMQTAVQADRPVMVCGDPGIGKTALFRQLADKLGREFRFFSAITKDPVDIQGVPGIVDGRTKWALPDLLPTEGEGILLIDDISTAPPLVQASLYGVVLDEAENWTKPPGWWIGAAGNLETNRALVNRMPTPLRSRFIHLKMEPDVDDLVKYWLSQPDFLTEIIAFIKFKPALAHDFNTDATTYPCPRTWEMVNDLLHAGMPPAIEHDLIAGSVGIGAANEFCAFLSIFRHLPSVDEILLDPMGADVPNEPGVLYALSCALSHKASANNIEQIVQYTGRLQAEFDVLCMTSAIRRDKNIVRTRAFQSWAATHNDVISG